MSTSADPSDVARLIRCDSPPDKVDDNTREVLGDGPFFFAVRKDLLVLSGGEGAREAITTAVAVKSLVGRPLAVQLALSRLAKLMERDQKGAQDVAKKVFKDKGSDRVQLTLEASKSSLELKLSSKTQVIAFGSLLDKEKRKSE